MYIRPWSALISKMPRLPGTHLPPTISLRLKVYNDEQQDLSPIRMEGTLVYTSQILNDLKWTPLEDRREAHRLTCLYKILHGQLVIRNDNEIRYKPTRERRGHAHQLNLYSFNRRLQALLFPSLHQILEWIGSVNHLPRRPHKVQTSPLHWPLILLSILTSTQPPVKTPQGDVLEDYLSKIQDTTGLWRRVWEAWISKTNFVNQSWICYCVFSDRAYKNSIELFIHIVHALRNN